MSSESLNGLLDRIFAGCEGIALQDWNALCRRISDLQVRNEKLSGQTMADKMGGPAYPESYPGIDQRTPGWIGGGATVWDLYAAAALQGMLANPGPSKFGGKFIETMTADAELFASEMVALRTKRMEANDG